MTNILKRTILLALAMAMTLTVGVPASPAGPRVTLRVTSGRQFVAEAAPKTDARHLWLSFRTRSAELLRPVAWESIVDAELDGQSLTADQLRRRLLESPEAPASQVGQATVDASGPLPAPAAPSDQTAADEALEILFTPSRNTRPARVATVQFDAHIANWDGDVEADGLIVHAIPIDDAGHIVPPRGHLEVELHARRRISFDDGPRKRGRRVARIGRWSKQLTPHMTHGGGAWFKLPFQAEHPEFNTQLGTAGLVHVKLVVPGDGVFEATLDGVRIRPYAPLRDNMEQVEGRRFLAHERTGRGSRAN